VAAQETHMPAGQRANGAALADVVLTAPEHGAGYLYPSIATGVPLAVACFGFSLAVLSLSNTHIVSANAIGIFVPVALATGGLGMFTGGVAEFRRDNVFGGTFGVIYACFLITTALILQFFSPGIIKTAGADAFGDAFGAYLILWAIFTAMLTVGARYINLPAFIAFGLLAVVYVVLGINNIVQPTSTTLGKIGGWVGLLDSASAWYLASALVLNPTCGREILPLFPYKPRS
jgi:succinate-acetate transporter protein